MTVLTANAAQDKGTPFMVSFSARFETDAEADAFVALFPKSSTLRRTHVTGWNCPDYALAVTRISLSPTKGNDRNETGIARYFAIQKKAAALGIVTGWTTPYGNSVATREEFEAAIA